MSPRSQIQDPRKSHTRTHPADLPGSGGIYIGRSRIRDPWDLASVTWPSGSKLPPDNYFLSFLYDDNDESNSIVRHIYTGTGTIVGQVKSSRGATHSRSEHPDPNFFLPPPLRGVWHSLYNTLNLTIETTYSACDISDIEFSAKSKLSQ